MCTSAEDLRTLLCHDAGITVLAAGIHVRALCTVNSLQSYYLPVAEHIIKAARRQSKGTRLMVGVSGPAGGGKTVFTALMVTALRHLLQSDSAVSVVALDGYHHRNAVLEERNLRPFKGRPETIDSEALLRDLQMIKDGVVPVVVPSYSRVLHEPVRGECPVPLASSCPIVLVEGILLFTNLTPVFASIRDLFHLRIFLDVPEPIARQRVNARKVLGGRSHEDTEAHYGRVDYPNFVDMDRGKNTADIVLTGNEECSFTNIFIR